MLYELTGLDPYSFAVWGVLTLFTIGPVVIGAIALLGALGIFAKR